MEMTRFTYLLLLVLSLAYPLYKSFEPRIRFHTRFRYIFPALILTALPFWIWDIAFEQQGIWHFNPDYTLGVYLWGLPIEEWLFFIIVPFACFFIYEVMLYFTSKASIPYIKPITAGLAIFLLVVGVLSYDHTYTFINFVLASLVLLGMLFKPISPVQLSGFYKGYLMSLLPFFLVNGILTKIPVVSYNNQENLSLRIFSIPVEDMVYLLSLLFINFWIYESIKQYDQRKKAAVKSRD
ncbi:MAG TPA: lycopene cyclase domain-containing protein [Bacteroidales bacterium]|nr:lycopene cyclase domain-containing protein [Bacteroidales bacterium]